MSRAISSHAEKAGRVIFNTHLSILLTKKKEYIYLKIHLTVQIVMSVCLSGSAYNLTKSVCMIISIR